MTPPLPEFASFIDGAYLPLPKGAALTADLNLAMGASKEIRASTVFINTTLMRDLRSAFGVNSESGLGRKGGKGAPAMYAEDTSTIIALAETPIARFGIGN